MISELLTYLPLKHMIVPLGSVAECYLGVGFALLLTFQRVLYSED